MKVRIGVAFCFIALALEVAARRSSLLLIDGWKFRFSHQVDAGQVKQVTLPHTWNTQDALSGKIDYKRGISEYGAGASIYHQQEALKQPIPSGTWHPENWQTYYHIVNYRIIAERDYVWGSFVWNMFDFGAAHRTEGDRLGINDKGLVTFDRKTLKDSYYFYKANWNPEPMVYIAERRLTERHAAEQRVMVFANVPEVELRVNGKLVSRIAPDAYATAVWEGVKLRPGSNEIAVTSCGIENSITDMVTITLLEE